MEANKGSSMSSQTVEFIEIKDNVFCRSCGKKIRQDAEICPHCGVRQKKNVSNLSQKNPGFAAVASFLFAGLGQIYNGEITKGFLFMIVQTINFFLIFIAVGVITYPLVWVIGIYDAYTTAEKINASIADI